jgi:hypothetical protein
MKLHSEEITNLQAQNKFGMQKTVIEPLKGRG